MKQMDNSVMDLYGAMDGFLDGEQGKLDVGRVKALFAL